MLRRMTNTLLSFLRGADVGLAAVLLALALAMPSRARGALLPLLLCLVAYLLRSAPEAVGAPLALLLPLSVGALLFPVAFWWLLHNVFDDRTDLPWPAWAFAAALVAAGLVPAGSAHVLQKLLAAGFVVVGLWRLGGASADDLVAARRSLRVWLLAYVGVHGLAVLGVELWLGGQAAPWWLDALNLALIGLAQGATLAFLVRPHAAALHTLFGTPATSPEPEAAADEQPPADPAPADPWLQRLDRLMAVERAYSDPALTLGILADRLGLPEYRLRELINRQLGYRNFPAFVNEHRLREVEQKLADPAFDRLPILTLALEAGFGSIGPFNRAFRERHGVTPSDFRAARRGASAPTSSAVSNG